MNEKELDQLLETDENDIIVDSKNIKKKIQRRINQQVYLRILSFTVIASLVILGALAVNYYYVDKTNYNPLQEDEILLYSEEGDGFALLMETYLNMTNSGKIYSLEYAQKEAAGIYSYSVFWDSVLELIMPENTLVQGGGNYSQWQIRHSQLISMSEPQLFYGEKSYRRTYEYLPGHEYLIKREDAKQTFSLESVIADIEQLPDSTILDVAISFEEDKTMDEVVAFMLDYPDAYFIWMPLTIDVYGQPTNGLGISLTGIWENRNFYKTLIELDPDIRSNYPNFYFFENTELSGETLTTHYASKLKLLLDHADFLDYSFWSIQAEQLKANYEIVQQGNLQISGIRCAVSKNDLLKMVEEGQTSYFSIYDLKLSYLQP